ncbi:MAG: Fic family protein [Clostridiales Family XIII bacterium]|nr:Fic family protein [Clostridiales Family XIII bacterium]
MTIEYPYTITVKTADYLAKIAEAATRLEFGTDFKRDIRLHRWNRMRTIHSSLAIEGNTLSLDEVAFVLDGKLVAGKQKEIKEVKNAYEAYDKIMMFDPYAVKDFLKAHKLMTEGLIKESGKFRSGDVGVFDGNMAVHMGARPQFVPELMAELFGWAANSELHPVLKSAILHYEIETIHPFADGNGRMGRLWQTLLLAKWNGIFAWIPMESVIYEKRKEYYDALQYAQHTNDSGGFLEFTLSALLETIETQAKHKDRHKDKHKDEPLPDTMIFVLKALESKSLSRQDLFESIGLKNDFRSFKRNVEPLIANGYIEMTVPDKPSSKLQKYRITDQGKAAIKENRIPEKIRLLHKDSIKTARQSREF